MYSKLAKQFASVHGAGASTRQFSLQRSVAMQTLSTGCRRYTSATAAKEVQTDLNQNAAVNQRPHSTKLEKIIRDTIKASGPMTISTYMQLCLAHPTEGYYMNPSNPVFGSDGDFITSPEISQVFGELIAIWHLSRWIAGNRPNKIRIIELGPGRGTLMLDALHTWSQFAECLNAIKAVHFVETSQMMRELQKDKITKFEPNKLLRIPVSWHDSVEEIMEQDVDEGTFTILIAHEFFDALPVYLLEKCEDGWHDVLITSEHDPTTKQSIKEISSYSSAPLRLARNPDLSPRTEFVSKTSPRFAQLPIGARAEVSPASFKIARQVADLVNNPKGAGGSALIVDYGDDRAFGGSLRAFKKHKIVDIFETPGDCDLTANVDFAYLKEAMQGAARTHGPITQATFLKNMNMEARIGRLIMETKEKEKRLAIVAAARRLVDPTGMGQQYKVLGVTGAGRRKAAEGEEEVWPFVPGIENR